MNRIAQKPRKQEPRESMSAPRIKRPKALQPARSDAAAVEGSEVAQSPIAAPAASTQTSGALPANIVELMFGPLADMFPDPDSWRPWVVFLKALFGLPMDEAELSFYQAHTGRTAAPTRQARELLALMGRRSGKSKILSLVLLWFSLADWSRWTSKGDQLMVVLVAATKEQAGIALGYLKAMFEHRGLYRLVEASDAESITLTSGIVIAVKAGSFRTIRGWKVPVALLDEAAFLYDGEASAVPLSALLEALMPAQAEFGNAALLMAATSPYGRSGWVWQTFLDNYARDDADVLVWKAPTWDMNPRVTRESLAKYFRRDANSAAAEYGAEFRDTSQSFISPAALAEVIPAGVRERPVMPGVQYVGFIDIASGTGTDSLTFAIAHRDRQGVGVLDVLREIRPPFNPENSIRDEVAPLARRYGIRTVTGDKYGAGMSIDLLRRHGLTLEYSERDRSAIYLEMLGCINTRFCSLLDNDRMREQFIGLERRTGRNRDSVDHRPNEHDDLANAAAGAIVEVAVIGDDASARAAQLYEQLAARLNNPEPPADEAERQRRVFAPPEPAPEVSAAIRGAIAEIERLKREEGVESWWDVSAGEMWRGPPMSERLRTLVQANATEYSDHMRAHPCRLTDSGDVVPADEIDQAIADLAKQSVVYEHKGEGRFEIKRDATGNIPTPRLSGFVRQVTIGTDQIIQRLRGRLNESILSKLEAGEEII